MSILSNSDDSQFQNPQAPAIDPSTVQQPAAPTPRPSVWGNVLKGALQGLALHGIPGAVAGAVDPEEAHRQIAQHRAMAQAKVEQAQNLPKFQSAQAANLASEAVARQRQADNADTETRIKLDQSSLQNEQFLTNQYGPAQLTVPYDPNDHEDKAAHAAMNTLAEQNGGIVPPVIVSHVGKTLFVRNMNDMAKNDASSLGQVNDYLEVNNRPKIAPGDWANKSKYPDAAKTQIIEQAAKFYQVSTSKDPVELAVEGERLKQAIASAPKGTDPAKLSLLKHNLDTTNTLQQTAEKAANRMKDTSSSRAIEQALTIASGKQDIKNANTPDWRPGVTADEKKKAELAENIAENANQAAPILQKRTDLFGPAGGRFTTVEQMMGNNDPDIAKLGTVIHNIAMANSGVHGFRSQEGVKETEQLLLNAFKNGPRATANALLGLTRSTQTFVDNARPEGFKTHSKQGGAVRSMGAQ